MWLYYGVASAASSYAQIPAASSARAIPTEVEQSEVRVTQIIARAEDHFRKGKLNLEDSKREQARQSLIKQSIPFWSRASTSRKPKVANLLSRIVERIYREEVPMQQPVGAPTPMLVAQNTQTQEQATRKAPPSQIGFRDQKFEPSPLDELSKLVFSGRDETVFTKKDAALEAAKKNVNFAFTLNPLIRNTSITTRAAAARRGKWSASFGTVHETRAQIFAEEGVPLDITWLGQVESAWKVKAVSWASASGLWQFIPSTGRMIWLASERLYRRAKQYRTGHSRVGSLSERSCEALQRQLGIRDGCLQHGRRQYRPCDLACRQQTSG